MKDKNENDLEQLHQQVIKKLDFYKKFKASFLCTIAPNIVKNYVNNKEKEIMVDFLQLDLFIAEYQASKQRIKIKL